MAFDPAGNVVLAWAPRQLLTSHPEPPGPAVTERAVVAPASTGLGQSSFERRLRRDAEPQQSRGALEPALAALGLPYRPEPAPAEDDRRGNSDEALLGVAVALDVLATWTQPLGSRGTILTELVGVLDRLNELAEPGPTRLARLVAFAGTEGARARGRLNERLAACLNAATGDASTGVTPNDVREATRRIERMSELVVRDARLALEANETTAYHQG